MKTYIQYGHAVCVRKHPSTRQWYLLDSERGSPILLTAREWGLLKGAVIILAKGSAYSYNSIPGAQEEGYTQVIDMLEYATPDQVHISKQPTTGVRMRINQLGEQDKAECISLLDVGTQDAGHHPSPREASAEDDTYRTVQNCKRLRKKSTVGNALRDPADRADNIEDANSTYTGTDQEMVAGRNAHMHTCQPAMNRGAHEATIEHRQQAHAPSQTAQADKAMTEDGSTHGRQEAASCAIRVDHADQSCNNAAREQSHSHGAAQGPSHMSTKTCGMPEATVNRKKKAAPKKAAAGNRSILSFYKKRAHMEPASAWENEQVTQAGRVEQKSRPAEQDCQTAHQVENAVQANCEADKQQNDTGSMKQPTRKRTRLAKDEQPQTARCWSMTVLTHNLMGTTTML